MSTIRPLATIAILAVVGVFLADKINKGPAPGDAADADWGADSATVGEASPPPFSPTGTDNTAEPPSVVTGVPPIDAPSFGEPAVEAVAPTIPAPFANAAAPPIAVAVDPAEAPPLPPLPPMADVPQASPATTPVDPLADLPLPDNIPEANYDGPTTGVAGVTVPPVAAPPAVEGHVYGLPDTTSSLPPAPPASPVATPIVPPMVPPMVPPTAPVTPPGGYSMAKPAIDAALARNELSRALLLLSSWRGDASLTDTERQEIDTLLGQLAGSVIYSNQHLLEGPHTVRPGETLETIAISYGVPWQLLAKINGVANPMSVAPGQTLKVVRGPFRATVDLSDGELFLLVDGRYAGRFPVQLDGAAAGEGQWRIEKKQLTADKQLVLAGAGGSAFGQQVVLTGVTASNPPGATGKIAVADRDLDDLFDILSVGSEVVVRR